MNNGDKPSRPVYDDEDTVMHQGLTKREHFAGLAFQSLIVPGSELYNEEVAIRADIAVKHADALLEALEK